MTRPQKDLRAGFYFVIITLSACEKHLRSTCGKYMSQA